MLTAHWRLHRLAAGGRMHTVQQVLHGTIPAYLRLRRNGATAADIHAVFQGWDRAVDQEVILSVLRRLRTEPVVFSRRSQHTANDSRVLEDRQGNLLRLRQCVSRSGLSLTTLRRAIKAGLLKAHTIGRGQRRPTYGIYQRDLERYIEASRYDPPDPPQTPTIGVRKKSRHFS